MLNPLHSTKRFYYHENTKVGKHEKLPCFIRHFVISCFRD